MNDTRLMSLEEALKRMTDGVAPLSAREVDLAHALGRVLAQDVVSGLTLPPWDNSAMDGFAVRSGDVSGASREDPVRLRVMGEVAAGHEPTVSVEQGTAVRVLTGGLMPQGADAVVPVEHTDAPQGASILPGHVAIRAPAPARQHVRRAGSDLLRGQVVLVKGDRITPAAVGSLVASGHAAVMVHARPVLAILSTGDELVPLGTQPGSAQIPDSNAEALAAQAVQAGADVVRLGIARDERDMVVERLRAGIAGADVLVASGGVSVGSHDVVRDAFEEVGRLELWRVAIQPGKPVAFGVATRPGGGECLFFGLPGNPVSSFVTFELFVRPVLRRLQGEADPDGRVRVRARLAEPVRKSAGRRAFLRVRVEPDPALAGGYLAHLSGSQGSHVLSALARANGLAVVPEDVPELPAGAEVEVIRLDMEVI